MKQITFCIPSKSNLRYLKTCIPSIRENAYLSNHEIIIFVDSDEDGTVEWLEQVKDEYSLKYFVNPNLGESLFGIGKAYDYCIEHSTTDIFMIFHADMMLGKDADYKAYQHLKPQTVVCSTRVEPPLHPNNGEKILLDFGMWPEEFKKHEFNQYVEDHLEDDKVTYGIFAPWMMYKEDFIALGGHDPILHSCREDSDVFNRMQLAGYKFIQPWNSLVYHLTGRGAGSFDGDPERHAKWKADMDRSTMEFIRKWGSNVNHTALMEPIVLPKYNIAYVVENCPIQLLEALEPWCDRLYVESEVDPSTNSLLNHVYEFKDNKQKDTSFDLSKRIFITYGNNPEWENDIVIKFDPSKLTNQSFQLLTQMPSIIKESGEIGEFELDIFKITISHLEEYQNNLIKV
jgi:glycosyltransferase involved in cell wall biosynthesis